MTFALRASGLQVRLGGTPVLHGVDVSVRNGCWTAVVGPNGAGKTTLLKALAHLLPYRGRVEMHGRDQREWTRRERALERAWLGQAESGPPDLRARDVVMLGRLPHQSWFGGATAQDVDAVESAMRQTQCDEWSDRALGSLSGGERQRVLLARALAVRAPILLMDEPLASLDPPHQSDWLHLVRQHVDSGGTAVSVLHEISMALHADELLVMEGGRAVHQGACNEAATHRALEKVFGHRIAVHSLAGQWVALPV